ncbi:MAG: hypothetical protein KAJ19_02265 [Gammaproteobacteria bacterium]|nr:hypothetical protein [Gammaproteobacteria bacterium]
MDDDKAKINEKPHDCMDAGARAMPGAIAGLHIVNEDFEFIFNTVSAASGT